MAPNTFHDQEQLESMLGKWFKKSTRERERDKERECMCELGLVAWRSQAASYRAVENRSTVP